VNSPPKSMEIPYLGLFSIVWSNICANEHPYP